MANKIQISVVVDYPFKQEFELECVRRNVTQKEAVEEAIRLWRALGMDAVDLIAILAEDEKSPTRSQILTAIAQWKSRKLEKPRNATAKKATIPRAVNER
jgi:hypothetical protein